MPGFIERALLRATRLVLPRTEREWMLGDLQEEHAQRLEAEGRWAAARWLAGETARNATDTVSTRLARLNGRSPLRHLSQDLRYALRLLWRSPGMTATIVVTLALGIGANTAIFSVVDALLFKPLPYPHAERLYAVTLANDKPQGSAFWPYPKFSAFAREQDVFDATAAYSASRVSLTTADEPHRVEVEIVTSSYFPMVGVEPAMGRVFTADEEAVPARDAVAIVADGLWRSAFAADPKILGRTVRIKDRSYTIVGVMPPGFRGQNGNAQMWLPVMMADHFWYQGAATGSSAWWMRVVGRLKPGVSEAAATARMPALTARVAELAPSLMKSAMKDGKELFQLVPFRDIKVDPAVSRAFIVLLAAVGFVLLIACANTANLLLGRAVSRRAEFAIRGALGASRAAIGRQVLVESLLIALVSGAAALAVSMWTLNWLSAAKPLNATGFWTQYARTFDYFSVSLNPRVAAVNFLVALGVGVLFGLLPARQASRTDLNESLKHRAGRTGSGRLDPRAALVLAELAFSVVLLVSAGLMVRSFARAATADLGFRPDGIVTLTASVQDRRPAAFYRELLDRVSAIPGVERAALAGAIPLSGGASSGPAEIEGRARTQPPIRAGINVVTPGFFATFGMPPTAGRLLSDEDRESAPRVAVVNRAFARAAWPGQDPVGKRVRHGFRVAFGDPNGWTTIVGVVGDAVYGMLEDPLDPMIYLPAWQPLGTPAAMTLAPSTIAVATALPAAAAAAAVREQLNQLDPTAPVYDIATMDERAARVTARYRYSSAMMGALAGLALLLTAIGTYGVIAYSVAMRTREIGIRVALGARPRDVLVLIVSGGLKLTVAGLGLGLAGALVTSRVLTNMLYGVTPHDPATFAGIAILITLVAALASYLPAQRAMRVDPVTALRAD